MEQSPCPWPCSKRCCLCSQRLCAEAMKTPKLNVTYQQRNLTQGLFSGETSTILDIRSERGECSLKYIEMHEIYCVENGARYFHISLLRSDEGSKLSESQAHVIKAGNLPWAKRQPSPAQQLPPIQSTLQLYEKRPYKVSVRKLLSGLSVMYAMVSGL